MKWLAWITIAALGCGGTRGAAPPVTAASCAATPSVEPDRPAADGTTDDAAARLPADHLARWRSLRDSTALPASEADALLPELELLLASRDPELRDGIGFTVLAGWLRADGPLSPRAIARLRDDLTARTAAAPVAGDAVFARSFAALSLSAIAAREVAAPVWTDAELEAQVAAATSYAGREVDLRGHTGATGWAHAAAHTADWMKFLARHPRLTAAQAARLLDGVAALVTRRHGVRFSHGEDERLAATVRAVARRALLTDAQWDAWLAAIAAPLAAGFPEPFDPSLYATQRNARDLLVSCFVALSFDPEPGAAAALARLRALMAG